MTTPEEKPFGGYRDDCPLPSRSVQTALDYLVNCIEADHGLLNGKTALYWHLIDVVKRHLKKEAS